MSANHLPMTLAAARALADRSAAQCNVNADDNWTIYSADFIADAEAALNAAGVPSLLAALRKAAVLLAYIAEREAELQEGYELISMAISAATGTAT